MGNMSANNVHGREIVRKMNNWPKKRSFQAKRKIMRTISQPRTLSANIQASQKMLDLFWNPSVNFKIARKLPAKKASVDLMADVYLRQAFNITGVYKTSSFFFRAKK